MDTSIRDAFVDGIYEVYSILFTDSIKYRALDLSYDTGIYQEDKHKQYYLPVNLVGRVEKSELNEGDVSIHTDTDLMVISIPKKSFDVANIKIDIEYLKKGIFLYKDEIYRVVNLEYGVNLIDTYMTYKFICKRE